MGLFSKDIKTMDDLFVHTLKDIYYAEHQILKALPDMIEKATDGGLKQGLQSHLGETRNHVARLEQVFKMHGVKAEGVDCPAIDGIIEEANEIAGEVEDKKVLDAALIAAAQAVEQRLGQAPDRRDCTDAQNHAGQENPKTAQTPAQLAPRQAQSQSKGCRAAFRNDHMVAVTARAASTPSIRPSTIRSPRRQRVAMLESWVISTRVVPWVACRPNSKSMICAPVSPSKLPVGSSARISPGSAAKARARAVRCCSPPESCPG